MFSVAGLAVLFGLISGDKSATGGFWILSYFTIPAGAMIGATKGKDLFVGRKSEYGADSLKRINPKPSTKK